jgi:hypothetical protein
LVYQGITDMALPTCPRLLRSYYGIANLPEVIEKLPSGAISGLGHLGSSESMSLRLPNQMEFFTVFFLSPVNGYYTSLVSFSTLSHCHRSWLLGARLVYACPHGG